MDQMQIDHEFKRERNKFPLERRKKVHKVLCDAIANKVSLIPHGGKLRASHADDNPVDLHFHKLAKEYETELCEVIDRIVIVKSFNNWRPIEGSFDFKFDLDDTTYLLLQQSDYLYELELALIKSKNGKIRRVRIGQGLTSYIVPSANEYALRLLDETKDI